MKIIFIASTFYIIYLMRFTYKKSYSKNEDTFPHPLLLLVAPCAVLSLLVTANYHVTEVRPHAHRLPTATSYNYDPNWIFKENMLT